jgi:ABC-type branched-subunit amino acid transport system substrate-binding protein
MTHTHGFSRRACLALLPTLALLSTGVRADNGVDAAEIRIGMANALSGPASGLGQGVKAGAEAYFKKVNAAGGVHGRKITLVSRDDGYEPARTMSATSDLIDKDKVFALFGYVGTPTSSAAVPLASKAQVPYLFPFTGAEFLRTPVNKFVFNVRASYFDETEAMVKHLTKDLGATKVAMFMQDDAFGEAVKGGVARALFKRDMKIHAETRFKRNTSDVDAGVAAIQAAQPDAVVFVGTYKQLAATVKKARAAGIKARFLTVSFIGTENFIAEAGADGDGVYITQVMPSPTEPGLDIVRQYQADMGGNGIGYTSLEGYVNAVALVEGLKKAGPDLTRAKLLAALETLNVDAGGVKLAFSATRHQGSSQVYLTRVAGGKAVQREAMD